MLRQGVLASLAVAALLLVSGCAEVEPQMVDVTREVEVQTTVEVTRQVTRVVERIVKETVQVVVTATPRPSTEPTATAENPAPTTAGESNPIGTVRVDHWVLEIAEVKSDPGMNASRKNIVLLGNLTNDGAQTATFSTIATLLLQDSRGRTYEEEKTVTWAAQDKYGAEIPASISPGASRYVAIGFDVPVDAESFTIIPGSLVASWGGNVRFSLP